IIPEFLVFRQFLVNIEKIHEIQPWFNHTYQIIMIDKQKLPVGRSFIRGLRQRLQM
ncbi:DNA-binding response regulator, partial [Levilactobacillus brevis]